MNGSDKVFVNLISVFKTEEKKECFEFQGHSGWKTIETKAQSDSNGIVEIRILSSTWSPHKVFNNGDVRILGCAVEKVNFIKDEKRSDEKRLDFDKEKKHHQVL